MGTSSPSTRRPLPVASPARTRAALRGLLRERRPLASATLLVLLGRSAAGLVGPAALGAIVDLVVRGEDAAAITAPFLLLVVAAATEGVLALTGGVLVARLGEGMLAQLREQVVDRALDAPLARIEQAGSGDLLSRVSGDVAVVSEATRRALPTLAGSALTVGLTLVGLLVLDWRLALAGLAAAPIQLHTLRWYLGRSAPIYTEERTTAAERTHQIFDAVEGAATVRAYGLTRHQTELVEHRSLAAAGLAIQANRLRTRFFGRLNVAELVGLAAILVVGFLLVDDGAVTLGEVTAAALYFIRLFDPFNALLSLIDEAQRAGAAVARLVGVVDLAGASDPADPAAPVDSSIEFAAVHFAYGADDVVTDLTLRIAPGERVALVGVSGAGKTTVASLVAGIHRARAGRILFGGVDLDRVPLAVRRSQVVLVSQDVHVFVGTLAENLRLVRPAASDAKLLSALAVVGAEGWTTAALPAGLATAVGSGGYRLSATQAQQLALARLVLADPAIAVLDEASAEAGSAGARILEAAAARALAGRTTLVVAHRLSQAAAADRVVVLEAGRIVESGPHGDLVAAGGRYAELWSAWSSGR